MGKLFFYTTFIFAISLCSFSLSQEQLYRNQENGFRIKFPKDWEIKDGDAPDVVIKAVKSGTTILIQVRKLITNDVINTIRLESQEYSKLSDREIANRMKDILDFNNYTSSEILEIAESEMAETKQKFDDLIIIDKNIRYLDNKKFAYVKYTASYRIQNIKMNVIIMMFMTIHLGKFYVLSGGSEAIKFDEMEPVLFRSISTFVFEDYNILSNEVSNKTKIVPDKQSPIIYFLFLMIFVITPSISVLLRFLIIKEALKEKYAIVIAIGLFLLALILWIYLSNQVDIFVFILTLSVGLNYLILRYSSKIQIDSQNSFYQYRNVRREKQFDKEQDKENKTVKSEFDITQYEEIEDSNLSDEEKEKLYAKILGLCGSLSKKDITKIYRSLIEKYHPDKVSHLGEEFQNFAHKKTKDINKAYSYFKGKYKL